MANYANAALLKAQARLGAKYNEFELRRKLRPAINMALENQDFTIPDAAALKVADQRPVEAHYLLKKSAGSSTTKAARHTGNKGDSDKMDLTWVRFVETFSFSHKLMYNKVIGSQEVFNHEMEQAIRNIQDRVETAAIASILANRCQLTVAGGIVSNGTGTWSDTNFALAIAAGEADYFIQNTKTFMFGRHFRGELDVICDLRLSTKIDRVRNQGAGNDTNTGFQFGGVNIVPTTDSLLGAYTLGQALVMPKYSVVALPWNDPLNRATYGRADDYVGLLTTMPDPFGMKCSYDVSCYTDRADTSGIDGHEQDILDQWEIALTVGFMYPPLVGADSPIHLIAQA